MFVDQFDQLITWANCWIPGTVAGLCCEASGYTFFNNLLRHRTNNLLRWQSKWSNKKKRAYTLHITTDNGQHTTNPHETAQALYDYWAPKFQEATTSTTLTAKYILPCVQRIDHDHALYKWTATYDYMDKFLAQQPDEASGYTYCTCWLPKAAWFILQARNLALTCAMLYW